MFSHVLVLVSLTLSAPAPATADNWPQFRGPQGAGHSDSTGLPVKWSEKENIVWKTAIHDKGWSSPVVWGDQVWLTTAREDGHAFYAMCIDRNSGKILHDIKLFEVEKPDFCIAFNSYASPTPVIEEGRVYVHFGTYGTVCLDTTNGKKLWERRDLHCDHFRGPGSSPILYDDMLFVNFDGFDTQFVVALNKKTGDTVWKKDRDIDYNVKSGDNKKAYATSTIVKVKDKALLISPAAVATIAYDAKTGNEVWKVYHGGMNVAQPPLFADGKVILSTGDGGLRLLCVRPDGHGDVTKTHIEWSSTKAASSRTAPLLVGDRLYVLNENGPLSCVAAKDGHVLWTQRVPGKYCASPIYGDGKLYIFNLDDGEAVVGEVGKEWKELAVNKLDDGCMATPAIAGKSLFVRTRKFLYRIEQK